MNRTQRGHSEKPPETNNNDFNQLNISQMSFSAFEQSFDALISTPTKKKPAKETVPKSLHRPAFAAFKKPRPPSRPKGDIKFTCKECGKGYVQQRYYKDHVHTHSIEKLCHRFPDKDSIIKNVKVIDTHVLEKCCSSPAYGISGQKFKDLVLAVQDSQQTNDDWGDFRTEVCEELVESISSQKFLLPSSLLNVVMNAAEVLLSNTERRQHFSEHVMEVAPDATEETVQHFISDYVLKCTVELISFISLSIRQVNNDLLIRRNINLTLEDEEIVHFCAGATIRSFVNRGKRFPKNVMWQRIVAALKSQILENDNVASASQEQKRWTEAQDRGKLLKVNGKCLEFFMCLYKCCILSERKDGALMYKDVLLKVHKEGGGAFWDSMIDDMLHAQESLMIMNGVVKSFTQTCGNGVARKRINALAGNKAIASVTLRHKVAPKSK